MRYALISYIALGLVLSLVVGIVYDCEGPEMFPTFFGSPFVFKRKSLGSSMEYFYSISGLLLNVVVWSLILYVIDKAIRSLIQKISKQMLRVFTYKFIVGIMIAFSSLNIALHSMMLGRGFEEGMNYWYWNLNQEAKNWGMTCKGELKIFPN